MAGRLGPVVTAKTAGARALYDAANALNTACYQLLKSKEGAREEPVEVAERRVLAALEGLKVGAREYREGAGR